MRRYFLLLSVVFLFSLYANAQISVKQGSFKEVAGFVNIDDKQHDDNGTSYAVIKIRTENITDRERRDLSFDGGAGTSFEIDYKDGEVWVYITYLASQLKITHPEFGSVNFEIPIEMKPKCGYELLLVNKITAVSTGWGSLTVNTKPENGATISLNGKVLKVKTPYSNNMIAAGKYEIKVSLEKYQTVTKTIEIADGSNEIVEIEMPFAHGSLKVTSEPSGAAVYVDSVSRGKTPLVLNDVITGNHIVTVKKSGSYTEKSDLYVEEGKSYEINKTLDVLPVGALNGLFTVNANGDQVVFSKGNLQYNPKGKIWQFAERQWDIIGARNANISKKYDGWIDLYGWGTGNRPTATTTSLPYYFESPFYDWCDNKVINGGDQKHFWRTLTTDEWDYILNKRNTSSGLRYVKAQVNGVNGVILLPDDWPSAVYKFKKAKDRYDSAPNKISSSEWESFETAGAVFLPMAGSRYEQKYYDDGGYYWTSTGMNHVKFDANTFDTRTHNYDLISVEYDIPYYGDAVRAARDVKK